MVMITLRISWDFRGSGVCGLGSLGTVLTGVRSFHCDLVFVFGFVPKL